MSTSLKQVGDKDIYLHIYTQSEMFGDDGSIIKQFLERLFGDIL